MFVCHSKTPPKALTLYSHYKYMCSLIANTIEYRVKCFLHHHRKILKHVLLKTYAIIQLASYTIQLVPLETL